MTRVILVTLNSPCALQAGARQAGTRQLLCRTLEQCRRAFPDVIVFVCESPGHEREMKTLIAPWLAAFPGESVWLISSGDESGQCLESTKAAVLANTPDSRFAIVRGDSPPPSVADFAVIWSRLDPGRSAFVKVVEEKSDLSARRCVFFDRDGVVNRSPGPGYVLSRDQFLLNEGIFEVLQLVKERDWLAILVTSQKGVGKGLMSKGDLDVIHQYMQKTLAECGAAFDGIYSYTGAPDCPHQPKPDPEMILSAAESFFIDLRQSWMIGDADRDIEMGKAAGLAGTIRIGGDNSIGTKADHTVENLLEIPDLLRKIL